MSNYKNPFAEYDANVMSSEQISDYFMEPYDSFTITKSKIIEDKSPIVFIGGRGTGKTMLLRQFSYNVQKLKKKDKTYLERLKETKFVGIYFRIDKPLLQSLSSLENIYPIIKFEENIFAHFLELTIFKECIEIVKILENDADIVIGDSRYNKILAELLNIFSVPTFMNCEDLDDLLQYVIDEINYIWEFQSRKAIDIDNTVKFSPRCNLIFQGKLSDGFCTSKIFNILGLNNISVLLLLDEFESFSKKQQMVINAAMRYNQENGMRLRIGMRPYGFKTYDTINSEDFIKEGRDYSKVEFDNPFLKKGNDTKYFKLIERIANKRLSLVPMFDKMNIKDMIGNEEDLESEAKEIVNGATKHIAVYLKEINKKSTKNPLTIDSLKNIRDENPLYEMECLRLLLKGEDIQYVEKALHDYKNKIKSNEGKKFADDYDKKYKLSFVFVLCSVYKREKKYYYGFTDFCYLSSGIIGSFIELCRRTFDLAYFRNYDNLKTGSISKKDQTDAAYEFSYAEKDMIRRIAEHGKKLDIFINNLGNVFSYIHRDLYLRYPETNSFPVKNELSDENKDLLEAACKWSLIFKKPKLQENSLQYTLSRVFSPVYKISYRTRGGFSPINSITDDYFTISFCPENILHDIECDSDNLHKKDKNNQLTLF